jgi:hypothetical protein
LATAPAPFSLRKEASPVTQAAPCRPSAHLSVPGVPVPTSVNPTPARAGMTSSTWAPQMPLGAIPVLRVACEGLSMDRGEGREVVILQSGGTQFVLLACCATRMQAVQAHGALVCAAKRAPLKHPVAALPRTATQLA